MGRKKGTSEKDVEDIRVHLANNSQVRAVKMEEIHELVRRISFEVLAKGEALETFIVTRLLNRDKVKIISAGEIIKYHLTNNIERGRQRQLLPAGENGPEQNNIISLKQLVVNLGSL